MLLIERVEKLGIWCRNWEMIVFFIILAVRIVNSRLKNTFSVIFTL